MRWKHVNFISGTLVNPKPDEFLTKIIEPVLCHLKDIPFGKNASQLLLATAIKESQNLKHRKQIGGPALGYFQIEPATHDDVCNSFLKYRPKLSALVTQTLSLPSANKIKELQTNDNYATAIARIIYLRSPAKLPAFGDTNAMAKY